MIENHMVIGDYNKDHYMGPDTCAICGDTEYDMPDTHMGFLCSSCTRKCVICGDWMLDEVGVKDINGDEAHKECAVDYEAS